MKLRDRLMLKLNSVTAGLLTVYRAYADRRGHLVRSWYGYQFANLATPTSDKQTPHC